MKKYCKGIKEHKTERTSHKKKKKRNDTTNL